MTWGTEIEDLICTRLAAGLSLRRICRAKGMPNRSTVLRWLDERPDFAARYARAHELQAEFHHDEMEEIERRVLEGTVSPQAANVVLGNKRWRMEKLKPKKYGAKIELEGKQDLTVNVVLRRFAPELPAPEDPEP